MKNYIKEKASLDTNNIVDIDAFSSDYILLIDEDCFICDTDALVSLINYQIKNDIHISGMPDGGMPYRCHNPIGINPFLSFLNLKEIIFLSVLLIGVVGSYMIIFEFTVLNIYFYYFSKNNY